MKLVCKHWEVARSCLSERERQKQHRSSGWHVEREPAVNSCVLVTGDSESSWSVHSGSERERPVSVRTPSDLTRNRECGPGTPLLANLYTATGNAKTPRGFPLGAFCQPLWRPFSLPTRSAPRTGYESTTDRLTPCTACRRSGRSLPWRLAARQCLAPLSRDPPRSVIRCIAGWLT
jgi:hypothetical protein